MPTKRNTIITKPKPTSAVPDELHEKEITLATLLAEEKERKRISEALHDSVSQLLYGVKLHLAEGDQQAIAKANRLLDHAIEETRNISFALAPSTLSEFGLPATLDELCNRLSTAHMKITCKAVGFDARGDLLVECNIFRIIQELVNNGIKHSNGNYIHVCLRKTNKIEVTVSDNGKGFNHNQPNQRLGTGLTSIKNRVKVFNGSFVIASSGREGTRITINIPLQ
jgi:signal transduction histidine kinase